MAIAPASIARLLQTAILCLSTQRSRICAWWVAGTKKPRKGRLQMVAAGRQRSRSTPCPTSSRARQTRRHRTHSPAHRVRFLGFCFWRQLCCAAWCGVCLARSLCQAQFEIRGGLSQHCELLTHRFAASATASCPEDQLPRRAHLDSHDTALLFPDLCKRTARRCVQRVRPTQVWLAGRFGTRRRSCPRRCAGARTATRSADHTQHGRVLLISRRLNCIFTFRAVGARPTRTTFLARGGAVPDPSSQR